MTVEDDVKKVRAQLEAMYATQAGELFCDLGGRISCARHLGMEGQGALYRRQRAKTFRTSMTLWTRVDHLEKVAWLEEFGEPMTCEGCRGPSEEWEGRWKG